MPVDVVDLALLEVERLAQQLAHARADVDVDLQAHRLAEAPPAQLGLDGLQEVVGLVGDLEVRVARDAEEAVADDLHPRKERVEVGRDDLLERDERVRRVVDLDEAVEHLGRHLDAGERLLVVERVAHERGERQRQAGDVGKRTALADGERGEHREDLAAVALAERLALLLGEVVEPEDADAVRRPSPGNSSPSTASSRRCCCWRTRARILSIVSDGVRPSGPGSVSPASIWSCTPATRIWKNSSLFELQIAASLTRSSSGMRVVLGELQDAVVEVQPRQLAAEVQRPCRAGRRRRAAAACRRGLDRADRLLQRGLGVGARRLIGLGLGIGHCDQTISAARAAARKAYTSLFTRRSVQRRELLEHDALAQPAARELQRRAQRVRGGVEQQDAGRQQPRALGCRPRRMRDLLRGVRDERLQPAGERLAPERRRRRAAAARSRCRRPRRRRAGCGACDRANTSRSFSRARGELGRRGRVGGQLGARHDGRADRQRDRPADPAASRARRRARSSRRRRRRRRAGPAGALGQHPDRAGEGQPRLVLRRRGSPGARRRRRRSPRPARRGRPPGARRPWRRRAATRRRARRRAAPGARRPRRPPRSSPGRPRRRRRSPRPGA